jgi:hypothetical protein
LAQNEIEEIQNAIEALENQRALLGDSVVDTAVAPLHEKLAALEGLPGQLPEDWQLLFTEKRYLLNNPG